MTTRRTSWFAASSAVFLLSGGIISAASFSNSGLRLTSNVPPLQSVQPWPASWSYNPFALDSEVFSDLTDLPLAFRLRPKGNYAPMLATSWSITPTKMIVHLRTNATWQSGQAITSRDVVDSFLIGGAFGWSVWNYVKGISAPNSHEVVFSLDPKVNLKSVEANVLGATLVPASLYGKYIVPSLQEAILKDKLKVLTAVKTKVENYSPAGPIGDGPYKITAMNTAQAILSKWSGFYGASAIHVPTIELYNMPTASTAYNYMFAGKDAFSWQSLTSSTLARWRQVPDSHTHFAWDYSQWAYYFNSKKYPLSLRGVRQALVYLANRPVLAQVGTGGVAQEGVGVKYITGLHSSVLTTWIPSGAIKSLNPYPHDPKKAAQILISLHFRKTASGWVTPNGKPFTLTIISPAGYAGPELSSQTLASEFTQFGIKTTAQTVEQPGYWLQQNKGQYEISWGWSAFWHLNPLASYYSELVGENYTPREAGYTGLGFGPVVNVPGLGKINITKNLIADQNLTQHAAIQSVATDYAKLVNEQVPMLTYGQKRLPIEYSTKNYVDWPSKSSPLWLQAGGNGDGALTLMLMSGYIHPR